MTNSHKILLSSGDGSYSRIDLAKNSQSTAIPTMTGNTTPEGVASASSASRPAYYAFRAGGEPWYTAVGTTTGWISYEFDSPQRIVEYSIMNDGRGRVPVNWTFEGANDDVGWISLDEKIGLTNWVSGEHRYFSIDNKSSFKKYRLRIDLSQGSQSYIGIKLIQMFNVLGANKITNIKTFDFINHGMSSEEFSVVDFSSDFTEKHYIQNQSTSLGSGRVFEQSLDISKTIKKILVE